MNKIWLEQYPKSVPATIDVAAHASLVELLEAAFASHGQKVAYTFMGKSLTFAEVDTWSRALGAYLQSLGLRRGDRVAVMLPNVPQYPVAIAAILRAGGLLRFGQAHLRPGCATPLPDDVDDGRPRTLFEKIIARHRLATPVTPPQPQAGQGAFVRADWRFIHEYYTGMAAHMLQAQFGDAVSLHEPGSIVVFEDHSSYMDESPAHVRAGLVPNMVAMCETQRGFAAAHGLRQHRTLTDAEAAADDGRNVAGISHAMMAEHYVLPGQVVVGTDSHTPHSGALGCVAFGVGTTDMANAFVTGAVRLTMPESLRVELAGELKPGVTAKDLVLHLLADPAIRAGAGVGKVFEFCGPVVEALSSPHLAVATNAVVCDSSVQ